MTNITTTPATPQQVASIEQITATRERILVDRIMQGDPRMQELLDAGVVPAGLSDEVLARYYGDEEHTLEHLYFAHCAKLPRIPVDAPAWADESHTFLGEWPDINIRFSKTITSGGVEIEASQTVTVTAEDDTDPSGRFWPKHEVHQEHTVHLAMTIGVDSIGVEINGGPELQQLGEAMLELAAAVGGPGEKQLHRVTEPGEPEQYGIGGGL